jgi:hypothetical protein
LSTGFDDHSNIESKPRIAVSCFSPFLALVMFRKEFIKQCWQYASVKKFSELRSKQELRTFRRHRNKGRHGTPVSFVFPRVGRGHAMSDMLLRCGMYFHHIVGSSP